MSTPVRILANLALAAAVLGGLETCARLAEGTSKYRWSERYGYELVPGYRGRHETVDAAGLRGAEVGPRRPGRPRVLCMGGSTTWGHKVDDDETWPVALQRELTALRGGPVEVLNGGISGWGLEQIVLALEHDRLERLRPDLVLVYSGWNHATLHDNPQIAKYRARAPSSQEKDGLLRSALVRWLAGLIDDVREAGQPERTTAERLARRDTIQRLMEEAFPPLDQRLADLAAQRDVAIAVVRYPGLMAVPPPADGSLDELYGRKLRQQQHEGLDFGDLVDDADHQYFDGLAVLDAAAAGAGLPVLDLVGSMLQRLPSEEHGRAEAWAALFKDRMHLTPEGDAAIGAALAPLIERAGLLDG